MSDEPVAPYDTVLEAPAPGLRWIRRGDKLVLQQQVEIRRMRQHVVIWFGIEWRDVPVDHEAG